MQRRLSHACQAVTGKSAKSQMAVGVISLAMTCAIPIHTAMHAKGGAPTPVSCSTCLCDTNLPQSLSALYKPLAHPPTLLCLKVSDHRAN